jgi:hypothetical protein
LTRSGGVLRKCNTADPFNTPQCVKQTGAVSAAMRIARGRLRRITVRRKGLSGLCQSR